MGYDGGMNVFCSPLSVRDWNGYPQWAGCVGAVANASWRMNVKPCPLVSGNTQMLGIG